MALHTTDYNVGLLLSTDTSSVTLLWNRGDTFTPIVFPTGGSNSRSIDVADFNNDGKPDIVFGNETSNNISILLNTTP